jgi:hypothetical protein
MERNPYAPPQALVADVPSTSHGLKQRRVLVMIVFAIISLGVYYLVWWFRRRPALNRLNSPRKLPLWPPLLVVVLWMIQFRVGFLTQTNPGVEVISPAASTLLMLFQFAVWLIMIIQTFTIKHIIEDHAATTDGDSGPISGGQVQLSGLMTFFFSIFYLQWAINRYVIGAER